MGGPPGSRFSTPSRSPRSEPWRWPRPIRTRCGRGPASPTSGVTSRWDGVCSSRPMPEERGPERVWRTPAGFPGSWCIPPIRIWCTSPRRDMATAHKRSGASIAPTMEERPGSRCSSWMRIPGRPTSPWIPITRRCCSPPCGNGGSRPGAGRVAARGAASSSPPTAAPPGNDSLGMAFRAGRSARSRSRFPRPTRNGFTP